MHLIQSPILSEFAVQVQRVEVVPKGSGNIELYTLISLIQMLKPIHKKASSFRVRPFPGVAPISAPRRDGD